MNKEIMRNKGLKLINYYIDELKRFSKKEFTFDAKERIRGNIWGALTMMEELELMEVDEILKIRDDIKKY